MHGALLRKGKAGPLAVTALLAGCLGGGVLLALSFRGGAWGLLAFVAPLPWLLAAVEARLPAWAAFASIVAGVLLQLLLAGHWLAAQFNVPVFLVTWCWVAAWTAVGPAAWVFILRRRDWPLWLVAPPAWVAAEALRARAPVGRPGVYLVGHSQADNDLLLQSADVWGVAGLSFVVLFVASALAELVRRRRFERRVVIGLVSAAALLAACALHAEWRLRDAALAPVTRVALVQPDALRIPGLTVANRALTAQLANLTLGAVTRGEVDLVAWPENSVLDDLDADPVYREHAALVAARLQAPVLISGWLPAEGGRRHASVLLIDGEGRTLGRHDKVLLLPGTEYVPFETALRKLGDGPADAWVSLVVRLIGVRAIGVPGESMGLLGFETALGRLRFGAPTCYENIDAGLVRQVVRDGADLLVNVTSEGRIGPSASRHLLQIARFRAVENRVSVLRAGNTGVTAVIDPLGRVTAVLEDGDGERLGVRGVLKAEVSAWRPSPFRPWLLWGDAFSFACAIATCTLVLLSWRPASA